MLAKFNKIKIYSITLPLIVLLGVLVLGFTYFQSTDSSQVASLNPAETQNLELNSVNSAKILRPNELPKVKDSESKEKIKSTLPTQNPANNPLPNHNHDHNSFDWAHPDPKYVTEIYPEAAATASPAKISQTEYLNNLATREIYPMSGFLTSNVANGQTNVPVNQELTFQLPVENGEVMAKLFKFQPETKFEYTVNGSTLTVRPEKLLRNTDYTFGFQEDTYCPQYVGSDCDENLKINFKYSFRTSHRETRVYGKSYQGRNLIAKFYCQANSNGKVIMLNAGIHGWKEAESGGLENLSAYLDNNPQECQGINKTIIIVEQVNPDCIVYPNSACSSWKQKYNSNEVNLNRNWPTKGWKDCGRKCGRGRANSEPEIQYLLNLTEAEKVTHLISYHSQWPPNGIVFPGDSSRPSLVNFCRWVSRYTGFPYGLYNGPEVQDGNEDVPGDQTVWAGQKGIDACIVEGKYDGQENWNENWNMYQELIRRF